MMIYLQVQNRSRQKWIVSRFYKEIMKTELLTQFEGYRAEVGFFFVGDRKSQELNEHYLRHSGPTDVITFDHNEERHERVLEGEAYIGVDVAEAQAREFGVSWEEELIRYGVHAMLHLAGFDDQETADRVVMKRHENQHMELLKTRFDFQALRRDFRT